MLGGSLSRMVVLSVPLLALVTLSPWGAASQLGDDPSRVLGLPDGATSTSHATSSGADYLAENAKVSDLSEWKYTHKSEKSAKSKKSKKSPKSKKSEKSKKPKKPKKPKK